MKKEVGKFRDGIFDLRTRRFGKLAEIMIKIHDSLSDPVNNFHDLYDEKSDKRIEVKFSTAQKAHQIPINPGNIIESVYNATNEERMMKSDEWQKYPFDSNIQQVKPDEFDVLYYGLFFTDKVMIFKLTPEDLDKEVRYSNRQHKGNVGEGQFHLNQDTYQYHLGNFFEAEYTYSELFELFQSISG